MTQECWQPLCRLTQARTIWQEATQTEKMPSTKTARGQAYGEWGIFLVDDRWGKATWAAWAATRNQAEQVMKASQ